MSNSIDLPSGFARASYPARAFGLALGFLTLAAVFYQNHSPWQVWIGPALHAFIWPHVAYGLTRLTPDPVRRERLNLAVDHFAGGMWMAAIQFNAVPSVLMLTMMSMDSMIGGGWRLCLRNMAVQVAGVALGLLVYGAHFLPYSSMLQIVACLPLMLIHPLMVGHMSGRALRKLRRQRGEMMLLSQSDSLTGMPNRRKFFTTIEELCGQDTAGQATPQRFAVGVLDLDGFKPINDLYGHKAGDNLLQQVVHRMQPLCGERVMLARLGGDEFALVITGGLSNECLLALGEKFCSALREPFKLPDATVQITASMGIATWPDMAVRVEDLYEYADYALYQAKRGNRGEVTLFSADHYAHVQRDAKIEQALRCCDFARELSVHFQPIIDARRRTVAFEALARWASPTLGPVPPGLFIPVAERTGLISPITRTLLAKALAAAASWPDSSVRLSFNLSVHDVSAQSNVAPLIQLIRDSGIDPHRLDLEITETTIMHDVNQARLALNQFARLGCGVTLDDFGTGYSSLTQLHALPLTRIKVDRSFVTGIHANAMSQKIVKSLLTLSRDMELSCVIEGVETKEEERAIRQLGGSLLQGFLYSKPLPEQQVLAWLEQQPEQVNEPRFIHEQASRMRH